MDFEAARTRMVDTQLSRRGIEDRRVLDAFAQVPRERFVPADMVRYAYEDAALPIAEDQTISQPYVVAMTVDALALEGGERVLDVGTGSGYAAAILSRLAAEVYSIERIAPLADEARQRLQALGYDNVEVRHGDGTLGWPEHAPYDAIAVAASGPEVPPALVEQLAQNGRLVMPVGPRDGQVLLRIIRTPDGLKEEFLSEVRFVPLIGAQGWAEPGRGPWNLAQLVAGLP
jgi:protein-L-isoaspartate(D-aspartate) O-methyltransferase